VARSSDPRQWGRPLTRAFFARRTDRVARALLGAWLVVHGRGCPRTVRLTETEAYVAGDPASHAFRGPTRRNRSMFGPPGTLYVFRIHQVVCANLVTRPGEAVLLRAGTLAGAAPGEASGPGRFCRALGITLVDDGADAVGKSRFEVRARLGPPPRIVRAPRVGLRKAVTRRLRFAIYGERSVSAPRPWRARRLTSASPRSSRAAGPSRRTRTRRTRSSADGRSGGRTVGR
jgi:DNA-3-methyladenine glycosylase